MKLVNLLNVSKDHMLLVGDSRWDVGPARHFPHERLCTNAQRRLPYLKEAKHFTLFLAPKRSNCGQVHIQINTPDLSFMMLNI